MHSTTQTLTQKINALTPDQLAKVEELVDSLQADDQLSSHSLMSEPAFTRAWDDPENDVYDSL